MVYYSHKVRERATSKPTLRDVGNLHEPYKSPPLCQRLTLIASPLGVVTQGLLSVQGGEQMFGECAEQTFVTGEQMFGEQPGSVDDFFSEQMFCPNKARDHRPRAYVQECGAIYPVVLVYVYHTVYVCIYLLCIIHYIIV